MDSQDGQFGGQYDGQFDGRLEAVPTNRSGIWFGHVSESRPMTGMDQIEMYLVSISVFLAPVNFLRHPEFYVTASDVFTIACLLLMFVNRTVSLQPFGIAMAPWTLGLMMLIGGLLASSIINGDALRGLIVSGQYFFAYFILPLTIVTRPWAQLLTLVRIFVFSLLLIALFGIYLIHIDGETNTAFVTANGRMMSLVESPNHCAALIALTLPMLLWLIGNGCFPRTVGWLISGVLIYGALLTASNSGLFAMIYGIGIYCLVTNSWRQNAIGLGGALTVFISALTWAREFLPHAFQTRVLQALESGDIDKAGTISNRMDLIIESLELTNSNILLGLGADQYRLVSYFGAPVHNAYLLIWTEGGLIAFLGFLLIICAGLVTVVPTLGMPGRLLTATCTFSTVTLFAALVNSTPHVYGRFWITPVLLSIALVLAKTREGPIPEELCKYKRRRTKRSSGRFPGP